MTLSKVEESYLLSLDSQTVSYNTHAREGHRAGCNHWVQKPECGERQRKDIVEERPEKILLYRLESDAGKRERLNNLKRAAFHEYDIAVFDRNIRTRANRNAQIRLYKC